MGAEDLLDDAMRLIPMVRRDAGLVPLVTPTSQIVGSQAVSVALDRKKGNPDYSVPSKNFTSLVKGEYGHTPVPVDPAFREKITGSPVETPYDVASYKQPENPVIEDMGGVKGLQRTRRNSSCLNCCQPLPTDSCAVVVPRNTRLQSPQSPR